jgi:hypothetical protein
MTSVMAKFLQELVILYVSYTLTGLAGFPSEMNMTVASNNEFRIMIK